MPKPDGMSDADFTKLHNELGAIFDGAVGFAALQKKDYPTAQKDFARRGNKRKSAQYQRYLSAGHG